MTKVITYGTYDLLHYGHIRLLERAKALGDYLIVGVTADDFDKSRGKINVRQSLMERIENVRSTGLADEIIVEEHEGQKIEDIRALGVDIFTVGSDWEGKFDYLKEYCKVVYLDRTKGISSTQVRNDDAPIRIGIVGDSKKVIEKFVRESHYVNGINIVGVCSLDRSVADAIGKDMYVENYSDLLDMTDAMYVISHPSNHYQHIHQALEKGKHVIVESPSTLEVAQYDELSEMAKSRNLIFTESIKTAHCLAYSRMILLAKSGSIGDIVSVDAVCTSLSEAINHSATMQWNSLSAWGPTALLPVFQLLGEEYVRKEIISRSRKDIQGFDEFTKITFLYPNAVASVKVGKGVKSEGELVISGTKGYIYVPAPWWKTDYFELRYENSTENRRYFFQLEGEGIRDEIVAFSRNVQSAREGKQYYQTIPCNVVCSIIKIMEDYEKREDCVNI